MSLREIGKRLRAARRRRGISLEQVADETKILLRTLRALERGRERDLPPPAYTRGHIRTYAAAVDLDPEELETEYAEQHRDILVSEDTIVEEHQEASGLITSPRTRSQAIVAIVALLGVVAVAALVVFAVVFWTGCASEPSNPDPSAPGSGDEAARDPFRVIVRAQPIAFLPREARPLTLDQDLAEELAEKLGRPLELVPVDDYSQMIDALLADEGDMIAASMTVTASRAQRVLFSAPYQYVDELLIVPEDDAPISDFNQLLAKEICVRAESSLAETLASLHRGVPGFVPRELPATVPTEEIIDRVALGECWGTLVDSHYWQALASDYDELAVGRRLKRRSEIALAFRPDDTELVETANEHIYAKALNRPRERIFRADLEGLKRRGRLRVITRNNAITYFLHRGSQYGFDYELMQAFAQENDLRLEVVVAPGRDALIDWLQEGRGDVIAAALTVLDRRRDEVAFTRPYLLVDQVLVGRAGEAPIESLGELAGREIHVRESSAYDDTLRSLDELPKSVDIVAVSEELETEEILARVERGEWDLTVCDSHILDAELVYGRELAALSTLKQDTALAWAVRQEDESLLAALNEFLEREYRGLRYNLLRKRYLEASRHLDVAREGERTDESGRISPYDEIFRREGRRHGIDWRLLVAIAYQESRLDPKQKSWAGARGLMQLTPRIARVLNVSDPVDPEQSIRGGAKHLRDLKGSFERSLPVAQRIRFALAAYNAGLGHVQDARRLARRQGLSSTLWYENVERAMLLLSRREYFSKARHGFCRGEEPVAYVRSVERLYELYSKRLEEVEDVDAGRDAGGLPSSPPSTTTVDHARCPAPSRRVVGPAPGT